MAYVNQDKKAKIAAQLKKVVPSGWKYSLAVRNHSTIVMTLRQAPVDILGNIKATVEVSDPHNLKSAILTHWSVNPYHYEKQFSGAVLGVIERIMDALNLDNYDKSDIMSDYFDVGHYVELNVGLWDSPFLDTLPAPAASVTLPVNYASLSPAHKAWIKRKANAALKATAHAA